MLAVKFIMDLAKKLAAEGPPSDWRIYGFNEEEEEGDSLRVTLTYDVRADQAQMLHVIDEKESE